jgi:hypothetical protein
LVRRDVLTGALDDGAPLRQPPRRPGVDGTPALTEQVTVREPRDVRLAPTPDADATEPSPPRSPTPPRGSLQFARQAAGRVFRTNGPHLEAQAADGTVAAVAVDYTRSRRVDEASPHESQPSVNAVEWLASDPEMGIHAAPRPSASKALPADDGGVSVGRLPHSPNGPANRWGQLTERPRAVSPSRWPGKIASRAVQAISGGDATVVEYAPSARVWSLLDERRPHSVLDANVATSRQLVVAALGQTAIRRVERELVSRASPMAPPTPHAGGAPEDEMSTVDVSLARTRTSTNAATQTSATGAPPAEQEMEEPASLDELALEVYARLRRRLTLERERIGELPRWLDL